MQMFLMRRVPGAPFFVSMHSGDDALIVYHEYTHGLVARLNTFPDGTDANVGFQAGAMHEAWADWYGLDKLENDGFVVDSGTVGDVVVAEYWTGGTGPGLRLQAADCRVGVTTPNCASAGFGAGPGGYTFGDMGNTFAFPEVHEDGQIWVQTMWQLRDVLGSAMMEELATRGQELAPNDPSFLDMRNAIIQADVVNNGGANVDALWDVFAERGMGFFASSPDGSRHLADRGLQPAARLLRGSVRDDLRHDHRQGDGRPAREREGLHRRALERVRDRSRRHHGREAARSRSPTCRSTPIPSSSSTASATSSGSAT